MENNDDDDDDGNDDGDDIKDDGDDLPSKDEEMKSETITAETPSKAKTETRKRKVVDSEEGSPNKKV